MNAIKIMAIVLIVAGSVGLLYGKFSYTKETHNIKLGPLDMSVAEKGRRLIGIAAVFFPEKARLDCLTIGDTIEDAERDLQ